MATNKPKPKTDQPEPGYLENSSKLRTTALTEGLKRIREVYKDFEDCAKGIKENTIAGANCAREIGILLQAECGHEQITFQFWQNNCEGKLPFNFNTATICISVARRMPQPAKTLAEAIPFVEQVVTATQLLLLPHRAEPQRRATIGLLEKFAKMLAMVQQPFQKAIADKPMEQWTPDALDLFLSETEWVEEERAKAKQLKGSFRSQY